MEVLATRRVYEGKVVNLRVDTLRGKNGKPHDAEVVEHAEAVVIIVRPSPDRMALVRQYRRPLEREHWEVPAGGMNSGETPEEAALRELREETGFRAHSVKRLWSAYSAPGFCTELLHFCVVDGYDVGAPEPDENEEIELAVFPLEELRRLIAADALPDAKTQIAVLWALSGQNSS
ncbi:MAG: NUDIX hydrolase [Candidatus Eremiobacteraeota bacterium]|nr:NUDIX hydrolase [Candidatus Eremiobacteraeota bacterium]